MRAKPEAMQLFMEGTLALSQVEQAGMRIDTNYLNKAVQRIDNQVKELEEQIRKDNTYKVWQKLYGSKTNLGSRSQLEQVLYKELKYEGLGKTRAGNRNRTDKEALAEIDLPFIKAYQKIEALKKARSTNLLGIKHELVDGILRPSFSLGGGSGADEDSGGAQSYRSSCSLPNSMNFPRRDPMLEELVRKLFIPRDDHQIAEVDFKVLEVGIGCCYHKDKAMMTYLCDKSKDMHRDAAMDCYALGKDQVSAQARHAAKNAFVFAEFYGSYFAQCAPSLWKVLQREKLRVLDKGDDKKKATGMLIEKHLNRKGIHSLGVCDFDSSPEPGTFVNHIKEAESRLWKRFAGYAQWKRDFFDSYLKKGGFTTLTGFQVNGVYRRNQVVNYPIQGSAFHCLLWSLIQFQKWLRKNKMRSMIVNQIHDSMILDIHKDERMEVLQQIRKITTVDLPKHWTWICVPLEIEIEVAPVGASWFEKTPWTESN